MRHDNDSDRPAARSRVKPLRDLRGYRVAEGDPDVRSWEVVGGDGRRIGTVNDLLVDTAEGKVRYLDVQLDTGLYRDAPQAEEDPGLVGATTVTEHLVRESISDEENRLTADHHLDKHHHTGERHVLFPVGQAEIGEESDRVVLPSLKAADAVNLPPYVPGEINPDYEQSLRQWFDPSFTPSPARDLYAHELYDQERFYRRRRAAIAQRER
jgi:hypothetical protein